MNDCKPQCVSLVFFTLSRVVLFFAFRLGACSVGDHAAGVMRDVVSEPANLATGP